MVTDDSRSHQWILFQKTLFEKHPAKNPTYGTVKAVKSFSRKQVFGYYNKHYIPNNMIISIVGNVGKVKEKVQKYFGGLKPGKVVRRARVKEPVQKKVKKFVEEKKTLNSYMVLGYKSVPRLHKDSYVFEVMNGVLGRGQSGWMFDEIRNKRGLAYQVVVSHHMLMGLSQPPKTDNTVKRAIEMKMSKSNPSNAIFMNDSEEDIKSKIKKAYCPAKVVEENPIMEYCRYIIFEKYKHIEIKRPEKFGGDLSIESYEDLKSMYSQGKIHPMDLKSAVSDYLNQLLEPVREKLEKNKTAQKLLKEITTSAE